MADIFITDTNGSPLETLNSEDGTTVGELFDVIGVGALRMGGILKAKKELVLTAGTYVFAPTQQRQQVDVDDDNILGKGVYEKLTSAVCFFRDEGEGENNKPIGTGFAVSTTTVYSVAHNFLENEKEVLCCFGKAHQHVMRRMKVKEFDVRLDYCVLETVPGEALLPAHLEISRDAVHLVPGKKCVLAAFQIGIQDDLEDLDPDLSVGVFEGTISKLYPRHFVYQCPSFAGDSGGAVVLKNGRVIGIHQETVIQARERIQKGEMLDDDSRLESVEASIDELLQYLSSGSIGLQLSAVPDPSK